MGNIAYMSRKNGAAIQSVDFECTVTDVNHECFGGVFDLTFQPEGVQIELDGKYCWDWWRNTSRRYGGKHPHGGEGITWAWVLFQNEVAKRLNCVLSDDGCPGKSWKPDPDKYRTFAQWVFDKYDGQFESESEDRRQAAERLRLIRLGLSRIGFPERLKPYTGDFDWETEVHFEKYV